MQFGLTTIAAALLSIAYVSAAPLMTSTNDANPTGNFYLVASDPMTTDFDDLFVVPYHTGAGWNDVVLKDTFTIAAHTNGTNVQFTMPGDQRSTYSLIMTPETQDGAMQSVMINADFKPPMLERQQFFFDDHTLRWTSPDPNSAFGGWLACIGTHGVPQLFWQSTLQLDKNSNCSSITLYAVEESGQ